MIKHSASSPVVVFSPTGALESEDIVYFCNYMFSTRMCKEKFVLDAGCGFGAGSFHLASRGARFVLGLDVSADQVRSAHRRYRLMSNLAFLVADVHRMPLRSQLIDTCVSVEVIEHLSKPERFLQELRRILKTDGTLVLTTPNKLITSSGLKRPIWAFHVKEFYPKDLEENLKGYFKHVQVLGNRIRNRAVLAEERRNERSWRYRLLRKFSQYEAFRVFARGLLQVPPQLQRIYVRRRRNRVELDDIEMSNDLQGCYDLVALCREPTN